MDGNDKEDHDRQRQQRRRSATAQDGTTATMKEMRMRPTGGTTLNGASFQVDHADIEQGVLLINLAYRIRLKKKLQNQIPSIHPSALYQSSVNLNDR